jgi:hypothetical protein
MARSPFEVWDDNYRDEGYERELEGRDEVRCAFCRERDLRWAPNPHKPGKYRLVDGEGKVHECLTKLHNDHAVIADDFGNVE